MNHHGTSSHHAPGGGGGSSAGPTRLISTTADTDGTGGTTALVSTKHQAFPTAPIPHIITTASTNGGGGHGNGPSNAQQGTTQVETHLGDDEGTQLISTGGSSGLTLRHHRGGGGGISGPNREQEIIATEM